MTCAKFENEDNDFERRLRDLLLTAFADGEWVCRERTTTVGVGGLDLFCAGRTRF